MDNQSQLNNAGKGEKVKAKPQLGKFARVIKMEISPDTGSPGTMFHDPVPYTNLLTGMGNMLHGVHESVSHDPMDKDEFVTLLKRMGYAGMAKKLAHSVSVEHSMEGVRAIERFMRLQLYLPVGLVPILAMYGKVCEDSGWYHLAGHPFLVLNYGMRAVHPARNNHAGADVLIDRENDVFVNAASPTTFGHAREYLLRMVEVWAKSAPPVTINQGGNEVVIHIPHLVRGAAGFLALFPDAFPVMIVRALNQLVFLEAIPTPVVWTAERVTAGAALGIQVVNFTRDVFDLAFVRYASDVQAPLMRGLGPRVVFEVVSSLSEVGTLGQVIQRDLQAVASSPELVAPKDLEMGWMMSGGLNRVIMSDRRFRVVSGQTPGELMTTYIHGMFKH